MDSWLLTHREFQPHSQNNINSLQLVATPFCLYSPTLLFPPFNPLAPNRTYLYDYFDKYKLDS